MVSCEELSSNRFNVRLGGVCDELYQTGAANERDRRRERNRERERERNSAARTGV